jgi:hypothetical protein
VHELANERKTELAALKVMIKQLDDIAVGEVRSSMMQKSMRTMMTEMKAVSDGAAEVRMPPA